MAEQTAAVLVLGAYGLAGRAIVRALAQHSGLSISAAGRDPAKLRALAAETASPRLTLRTVDACDAAALADACRAADVVINAVGPFPLTGEAIAATVLGTGTAYVDIASEQAHYRALRRLDGEAQRRGVTVLTGVGAIPGLSGVLMRLVAQRLSAVDAFDVCFVQGRTLGADAGLASLMSGVLEASATAVMLVDGREVPVRIGADRRDETLPAPFGRLSLLGVPTLDTLTVPRVVPVRTLRTYFGIADVPPGFLALVRLLQPHRRRWAYGLLRRATSWTMRRQYARAVRAGRGPDALLRVVAHRGARHWAGTMRFRDGGEATAYLPLVAARRLCDGRLRHPGVSSAVEVFEPTSVLAELDEVGWSLPVEESAGPECADTVTRRASERRGT